MLATSCRSPEPKTIVEYRIIKPPEVLLEPCPEVPLEIKTNGDMVLAVIDLHTQYFVCSMKVQSLIQFYKEAEERRGE